MPSVSPALAPPQPWLRRIVRSLLLLVLVLAALGFLYQNVSEARDRRFNPMLGRMVEADGLKMHIDCMGDGVPAVILDAGLGDDYLSWRKVQPPIAKFTRVCSYDRAGMGYSEASSKPRTSRTIAGELQALLQAAGIAPPYILVGHSAGGYNVRVFTSLYRSEVVGMVLVDASHPDQENRLPPELKNMEGTWRRESEFLELAMPIGIPRLLGLCDPDASERAARCNFESAREGAREMEAFQQSATQAAAAGSLDGMPLAVLSHDPDRLVSGLPPDLAKPTNVAWEKMQEELAHLSTRGTQTVAKNSSHYIQNDRPDLVIEAVRVVLDEARSVDAVHLKP
jgi:pimeloyl-ACP methyl ester carboxylesterase